MPIPTQQENPNGLHQRYMIFKRGEETLEPANPNADYFVLRLDRGGSDIQHIKACRVAINAYADTIKHHLPQLAKDLKKKYPLINK